MRFAFAAVLLALLAHAAAAQTVPSNYVPFGNNCAVFDSAVTGSTTAYIAVRGVCNVPSDANAVMWTLVATDPVAAGTVQVFDSGILPTGIEPALTYPSGTGTSRTMTITRLCYPALECSGVDVALKPTSSAHFKLVVLGYFTPAP